MGDGRRRIKKKWVYWNGRSKPRKAPSQLYFVEGIRGCSVYQKNGKNMHCWKAQLAVLHRSELMVGDGVTELGSLVAMGMIEFSNNRYHLVILNHQKQSCCNKIRRISLQRAIETVNRIQYFQEQDRCTGNTCFAQYVLRRVKDEWSELILRFRIHWLKERPDPWEEKKHPCNTKEVHLLMISPECLQRELQSFT